MKLALLSESPADEAALAVLVQAVLGHPFKRVHPSLRARGWPSVLQVLPAILRHLHFKTDVTGLIVVVDSDDTVVHTAEHQHHPQCRLCQLRAVFRKTIKNFPAAQGRERVLQGIGLAVPAVEGWYLCGREPQVSEIAWVQGQESGRAPYTRRELKARVYGTDRPSLQLETEYAVAAARRHALDLRRLEYDFPGFAALSEDIRAWPKLR